MGQIRCIEIYRMPVKLCQPFVISLESFTHANNLAVAIYTSDGRVGWGECSPFPTINGETMESGLHIANWLAAKLIGVDYLDLHGSHAIMQRSLYGNFSVKSAIDMALHDLAAQARNIPLYEFWGPPKMNILQTDYTVSLGDMESMVTDAQDIKKRGFRYIKVKLGGLPKEDIQRVKAIRKGIGDAIPLRLDANQGWDFSGALTVLKALAEENIQFCEAPIPRYSSNKLAALRQQVPVPIMADESCFDHHDARRLLASNSCDYINVKLGKTGGLLEARLLLEVAEEYGTKVQIGGFLESRLAFTAAAHLALSSAAVAFVDMDTPLMLAEDPVQGGIRYGSEGIINLPEGMGLGASMLISAAPAMVVGSA